MGYIIVNHLTKRPESYPVYYAPQAESNYFFYDGVVLGVPGRQLVCE